MSSALPVLCLLLLAGATLGARVPQDLLGAEGHGLRLAVQDGNAADDELGAMIAQLPAAEGEDDDDDDDAWEVVDEDDPYDDLQSAKRTMALAAAAGDHPPGTTGLEGAGLRDYDNETFCHDRAYRKRTMKILYDRAFMGLFYDLKHQTRFEGSGVAFVKGRYYVIFDSLRTIGRIDQRLSYRGPDNFLIGDGLLADSQFEGISYSEKTDSFIIVRESWSPSNDSDLLVPLTEEVHIKHDESQFTPLRRCPVDFQLQDINKGFESIYYFEHGGERYLLGLCESNSCLTVAAGPDSPGLQRGNGRLILTKYRLGRTLDQNGPRVAGEPVGTVHSNDKTECVWEYVKTIQIPESAYMLDYAGIAFRKPFGKRVAIVSQEDASVWLGKFNWTTMEFVEDKGKLFHLPRDNHCNKIFCNVEGIQFIDDMRVVLTSDKHKASVQSYHCADHDQSIHVFGFP